MYLRSVRNAILCAQHGAIKIRKIVKIDLNNDHYSVRQEYQINNQHFISIKLQISNNI